jgi:hypothetical protein
VRILSGEPLDTRLRAGTRSIRAGSARTAEFWNCSESGYIALVVDEFGGIQDW